MSQNASSYASTNELKKAVGLTYRKVLDDSSEKFASALQELVRYDSVQFN